MTPTEKWTLFIQGLAAFTGLVLAVLAIWGDWVRSILAAPKLSVALRSQDGELTCENQGPRIRYYHLVVRNSRSWAHARNVRALLTQVERPGPDGQWQQALATGSVELLWQFGQISPGLPMIGPERICDLGCVLEGEDFQLLLRITPNSLDPKLQGQKKLRVRVQAVADNGQSEPLAIEIAWDGQWVEGAEEMRSHLVVKEIK